jgi:insertion element IS1 protein InsB
MGIPESCPAYGSTRYKKTGHTRHGKQHHLWKNYERQFRASAEHLLIASERCVEIANLLRERLSLRGMCRAVGVSLTWLLHFMVECFATCPDHVHVRPPPSPANVLLSKLEAEANELWSLVQKKANKPWIWLTMDATTRQIMAFHVGARSRESAKALWGAIPEVYQGHTTFHTDPYKKARNTNPIERFNTTLRQCQSCLVRDTLSFSKKIENPIGAITFFICHSNLEKAAALLV